jgi:hypothetical protein
MLERRVESLNDNEESAALETFARRAVRRPIEVSGALVSSVYERGPDWRTRPYFALSYDRETYVYLETIAPDFQADLASHRHWASVGKTVSDRQLMFELAVSEKDFELLEPRCRIDFTCELAAVIRGGKSVYCRALIVSDSDCPEPERF